MATTDSDLAKANSCKTDGTSIGGKGRRLPRVRSGVLRHLTLFRLTLRHERLGQGALRLVDFLSASTVLRGAPVSLRLGRRGRSIFRPRLHKRRISASSTSTARTPVDEELLWVVVHAGTDWSGGQNSATSPSYASAPMAPLGGENQMLYLLLAPISIVCVIILLPLIPAVVEGIIMASVVVIIAVFGFQLIYFLLASIFSATVVPVTGILGSIGISPPQLGGAAAVFFFTFIITAMIKARYYSIFAILILLFPFFVIPIMGLAFIVTDLPNNRFFAPGQELEAIVVACLCLVAGIFYGKKNRRTKQVEEIEPDYFNSLKWWKD